MNYRNYSIEVLWDAITETIERRNGENEQRSIAVSRFQDQWRLCILPEYFVTMLDVEETVTAENFHTALARLAEAVNANIGEVTI